jgi:predicted nucleic acid-binding protein
VAESAIANASLIILLARAGCIELLHVFSDEVIVPAAVAEELQRAGEHDVACEAMSRSPWINVVPDPPIPANIQAWDLGPGESAVLALALAHLGCEAVIDDLAARRCAAAIGVLFRGTLGIVLVAKQRGEIAEARPIVERLLQSGMYLSAPVVRRALALVGEQWT